MKHFLVDVASIVSAQPRDRFDPEAVESLADSILESDGLLKPVVLKATGPESFEVVDRHLEYWAAVRAREKDPRKGEMVNAYVALPKSTEAVQRQLAVLKRTEAGEEPAAAGMPPKEADIAAALAALRAGTQRTEAVCATVKGDFESLAHRIDSFADSLNGLSSLPSILERMEDRLLKRMEAFEEILRRSPEKKPGKSPQPLPEEPFSREVLEKLTLPVLKEIMKKKGIPGKGLKKKAEFIDAILGG